MPPRSPVLVVEDDPEVRESLRRLLSDEGYEVTTAAEGQEGLERLHARPHPCCVVLDLMLPNMDGFEFRVRQMGDPEVAAIPVIVLSAGGDVERKVAHLDVAAAFTKPPDFDRLLACVAGCRSRN
jgi:two-component system, chemotaxis family, chemotaxis protein CheY